MADIVVLGADHAGYALKEALKPEITALGYDVLDVGTNNIDSVDYPDFGHAAAKAITQGKAQLGIIVCGSGIGISIAANRHTGIRCALCTDATSAQLARQHNDANILALGARMMDEKHATDIVKAFFSTEFEGGRHEKRVKKLEARG